MPRRPRPSLDPIIAENAPTAETLTDYDYEHFIVYIRLLDAETAGADWREAVRIVLKIDAAKEPMRAQRVYDSHMARARWMTEHGFRHLLTETDAD